MAHSRLRASSALVLTFLGGCVVWESDYQAALRERDEKNEKLEQRLSELEQKGPLHDQAFYDRVIADVGTITIATRAYAEQLAAKNKTYLEDQTKRLTETQQSSRTALESTITADGRRNQTARTELSVQLQDLQDRLAEWATIIGDPNRQDGIYADRTRAQQESERLTSAYRLIGDIRTSLATFSDTRAFAQQNYETFRAATRTSFTQLGAYLADPTKTEADKIGYINQTFTPQIGGAHTTYLERARARSEAEPR